jgi:hypothetical protein
MAPELSKQQVKTGSSHFTPDDTELIHCQWRA